MREIQRAALARAFTRHGLDDHAARIQECGEFGTGWRCEARTCGRSRVQVPRYCRVRTCPVCAPLEAVRIRRELERKIRFVDRTQQRPAHRWMFVTPTLKTHPAVLARADAHTFVREFTDRAVRLLREVAPGEPDGATDGSRKRRRRRGAGGALALEVGKRRNLHAHAIVYGRYIPKTIQDRWRRLSRYQACAQCGAWSWKKSEQPCPTSGCPLQGKPMDPQESFIVHIRAVRGGVRAVVTYVTKYTAKPAQSEELEDLVLVERIFRRMKRIRTWGSIQGIPEDELEAEGCGKEKPEPLVCEHCGGELHPEDTMRSVRVRALAEYEPVDKFRRRMRRARDADG